MRQFLISILFLVVCFPQCQIKTNTIVTEEANTIVTEEATWTNGILYRTIRDTITITTEEQDFNFFKRRFNLLYLLPDTLIKKKYKSSTVKTWALKNKKEDLTSNWFQTYIYDDKGRLKYFFYSGCNICSQRRFEYNIVYTPTGDVEKIFDRKYVNRSYQFYYGKNGNINMIEYFEDGKLSKRIKRIV